MPRTKLQNKPLSKKRVYQAEVQRTLIDLLQKHETATSDDIQCLVNLPGSVHPNSMGSAIAELSRDGVIEYRDVTLTKRPSGRGRLLRVWRLKDADTAMEWIAAAHVPQELGAAQ